MRQHSEPSRCEAARESGIPRNRRGVLLVNGAAGMATIPFQQLLTGTGDMLFMACLEAESRKKGHVDMMASCPLASRRAKVS